MHRRRVDLRSQIGFEEIVEVEQGTSKIEVETRAATVPVEKLGVRGPRKSAKRKGNEKLERDASAETATTQRTGNLP